MKKYIAITIFLCVAFMGVVYAGWTDQTAINSVVNTGCLSMALSGQKEDYTLDIIKQDGKDTIGLENISMDENGTVTFQIADSEPLDVVELMADCQSVCLNYPLLENEENTVSLISLADAQDQVVLKCTEAKLVCGDETQELSEEEQNSFAPDIVFDDKKTLVKDEMGMRIEQEMTLTPECRDQLQAAMQLTVAPDRFANASNNEIQLITKYQFETILNLHQQEGENNE